MLETITESRLFPIAIRILAAFLVLIVTRWLAGRSRKWLTKSLTKSGLTESLVTVITTLVFWLIMIIGLVLILTLLGVPLTATVGALGIIVVVLAITLQSSLGNLAATTNMLLFKPFEIGDLIQSGAFFGMAKEIQIFSVVIQGVDGKVHTVPSSAVQAAGITNYSTAGQLRVDMVYGISYDSDVEKAKQVIRDLFANDERVLKTPAPQVFVQKLNDSSVDIAARPTVGLADFLSFQDDIVESVKREFDAAGVSIPYPRQDIQLVSAE